jgi:hypothetical protein
MDAIQVPVNNPLEMFQKSFWMRKKGKFEKNDAKNIAGITFLPNFIKLAMAIPAGNQIMVKFPGGRLMNFIPKIAVT